jgi:hypothetical protein
MSFSGKCTPDRSKLFGSTARGRGFTSSERAVLLSPEIDIFVGADVVHTTEGRVAAPRWPGACDPAGVEGQGTFAGVPQEPGRPLHLLG